MNTELRDAVDILGKERNISKEVLLEAIENSLLTACKNHFGTAENCKVNIDPLTCETRIYQTKTVVDKVEDPVTELLLSQALAIDENAALGQEIDVEIDSQMFGRIATQNAKGVIVQKIREEERNSIYREYAEHEHDIMTGVVQKFGGRSITVGLGKVDGILPDSEQIRGEALRTNQRIKVYLLEVKNTPKGPKISVSRTHPDLVKCLFKDEVSEIREGLVEIVAIAREAGSRTKMAVVSYDENVDPVGACVGVNGTRVNSIVEELGGEKIDIINWDDNPAFLIENALSPAKVICVVADEDSEEALVIVPDYQLSLAIGKEGQNARLAAKLTGYKIDIKSETQAEEEGLLEQLGLVESDSTDEEELTLEAEDLADDVYEVESDEAESGIESYDEEDEESSDIEPTEEAEEDDNEEADTEEDEETDTDDGEDDEDDTDDGEDDEDDEDDDDEDDLEEGGEGSEEDEDND